MDTGHDQVLVEQRMDTSETGDPRENIPAATIHLIQALECFREGATAVFEILLLLDHRHAHTHRFHVVWKVSGGS